MPHDWLRCCQMAFASSRLGNSTFRIFASVANPLASSWLLQVVQNLLSLLHEAACPQDADWPILWGGRFGRRTS
jgi:hypothetical protein